MIEETDCYDKDGWKTFVKDCVEEWDTKRATNDDIFNATYRNLKLIVQAKGDLTAYGLLKGAQFGAKNGPIQQLDIDCVYGDESQKGHMMQ